MLRYFDAHAHLQDGWLTPYREELLPQLRCLGVEFVEVNGTCEQDWADVAALTKRFPWCRPNYGLHPWHVGNRSSSWLDKLKEHLNADPKAWVGEIGLDRWMVDHARARDVRLQGLRRAEIVEQIEVLELQLAVAAEQNRPVTLHCLQAWGTLHDVLQRAPRLPRGFLLHAYGGPSEMVKPFAALGAYFSFNGAFLGPRHEAKRNVFKEIPQDRVLVETDAPAMPLPEDRRRFELPPSDGNVVAHPGNLIATYAALAELRELSVEALAAEVEANFHRLFGPF